MIRKLAQLLEIRRGLGLQHPARFPPGEVPAANALEHALATSKDQVPRRGIRSEAD
jgi:hypothetical protein